MKKTAVLILAVFAYSDVFTIITEIKKMESFTPAFKKIEKYNIFSNLEIQNNNVLTGGAIVRQNNLILNAIFQNKANINGVWLKPGDVIEGYKIVKINNNEVVLKKNKKTKKLIIKSNILKVVK